MSTPPPGPHDPTDRLPAYGPGYGPQPPAPRRGRPSNTARFWIGVALSLPALVVVGLLQGLPFSIAGALDLPSTLAGVAVLVVDLALLAGLVWGIVAQQTRYLLLGILAGVAVLFVLAAGACVVILAGLGTSN